MSVFPSTFSGMTDEELNLTSSMLMRIRMRVLDEPTHSVEQGLARSEILTLIYRQLAEVEAVKVARRDA